MRLASFVDPKAGREARFGIVRGENMIDVVAAANALHRAVGHPHTHCSEPCRLVSVLRATTASD